MTMTMPGAPAPPTELAVRLVWLDWYLAPPVAGATPAAAAWSGLHGGAPRRLPVVRLFGATPGGQKACVHLHGCLPCFYVPYPGDLPQGTAGAAAAVTHFALALEAALEAAAAAGAPARDGGAAAGGGAAAPRRRVHGACLVAATPFYGFHAGDQPFIKVQLYDPRDVKRAAAVALDAGLLGRRWQPHESHVPFLLQVKIDLNLRGMGWVRCARARLRPPLPPAAPEPSGRGGGAAPAGDKPFLWTAASTPASFLWGGPGGGAPAPPRHSTCALEADVVAAAVLNRGGLQRVRLEDAPADLPLVDSLLPLWEEERGRCPGGELPTPPASPPRAPRPLPGADEARARFAAVAERQRAALLARMEAEGGGSAEPPGTGASQRSQLLAATQPANRVAPAGGDDDLGGGSGSLGAPPGVVAARAGLEGTAPPPAPPPGSQLPAPSPTELAWAAVAEGGGGGDLLSDGDSDEGEDDDDLLLALAAQLGPAPAGGGGATQGGPSQPPGSAGATPAQVLSQALSQFGAAAPGSQGEAALRRALSRDARRLAAAQRECDDILECSQAAPGEEEDDGEDGDVFGAAAARAPPGPSRFRPAGGGIPQLDGAGDASPRGSAGGGGVPPTQPLSAAGPYLSRAEVERGCRLMEEARRALFSDGGAAGPPWSADAAAPMEEDGASPAVAATLPVVAADDGDSGGSGGVPPTERLASQAAPTASGGGCAWDGAITPMDDVGFEDFADDLAAGGWGASPDWLAPHADGGGDADEAAVEEQEAAAAASLDGGAAAAAAAATFRYARPPPTAAELAASGWAAGAPPVVHTPPHYSNPAHAPTRGQRGAGALRTSAVEELPPFSGGGALERAAAAAAARPRGAAAPAPAVVRTFALARPPPSRTAVEAWLRAERPAPRGDPAVGVPAAASRADSADGDELLSLLGGAGSQDGDEGGGPGATRPASPKYDEARRFAPPVAAAPPAAQAAAAAAPPPPPPPQAQPPQQAQQRRQSISQISAPPASTSGAGATPASQLGLAPAGEGQHLKIMCIEVHADCRGSLLPNPLHDAVRAVALSVASDADDAEAAGAAPTRVLLWTGAAGGGGAPPPRRALTGDGLPPGLVREVAGGEGALLDALEAAVVAADPDVLVGWDVARGSLGYLADRAAALGRPPLLRAVSRLAGNPAAPDVRGGWQAPAAAHAGRGRGGDTSAGAAGALHVAGRIVINGWRLLRADVKLQSYTLEACAAAVARLRLPAVPPAAAARWFDAGPAGGRWRALAALAARARAALRVLAAVDAFGRTAELARVFGIDFTSVLERGSQYRVESMMLRLARSQNYVAVSPAPAQAAAQPAMEALPLILEPEGRFYADPVVVLDFQSLYPSQVIAHNLCFSTLLGRPAHAEAAGCGAGGGGGGGEGAGAPPPPPPPPPRLGVLDAYAPPAGALAGRLDPARLVVAPNGVAFAPPAARRGVLPRLLAEVLRTRVMVKGALGRAPPGARARRAALDARQFALKLIANVTYGYAAAGFSGRMPCAELADAIVASGRATLEAAVALVEGHPTWRARVVYGDTDSLFVLLPGRSRAEAAAVGAAIAAAVTAAQPPPVALKLEKVYHPCILASKKRYCGLAYAPGAARPAFDAKGIETVRRDSCPAVAKVCEGALRLLLATRDASAARAFCERQWARLLEGRVSARDFVFAREVRLGTYSARPGATAPPGALVAARALAADPRAGPAPGERVRYVVVSGGPRSRLVDLVVAPAELVGSGGRLRLNAAYYVGKQMVPALQRTLGLAGADVGGWWAALPRRTRAAPHKRVGAAPGAAGAAAAPTIDSFYLSRHCGACDALTLARRPLCEACAAAPQAAVAAVARRAGALEARLAALVAVCLHCGGGGGGGELEAGGVACASLDCGLFFERHKARDEAAAAARLRDAVEGMEL